MSQLLQPVQLWCKLKWGRREMASDDTPCIATRVSEVDGLDSLCPALVSYGQAYSARF